MSVLSKFSERLFLRYVVIFTTVVCGALISSVAVETWFSYQDSKAALSRIELEQVDAAAGRISEFVRDIEAQLSWTTHQAWTSADRDRLELWRLLLRQVPAITELQLLDSTGREQLQVSRLGLDTAGSNINFANEPKFYEAKAHQSYHSSVYFRSGSEPYMTIALAGTRRNAFISVAEVNLKFIWDVVSQIKVGTHGYAYVVDGQGQLIAHPDISLVLRNIDYSSLAQVKAASVPSSGSPTPARVVEAEDIQGRRVLTAYATIAPVGWLMFVELPAEEAYAPLHASVMRSGGMLLAAVALAFLTVLFVARRVVRPLERLEALASTVRETKNYDLRIDYDRRDEIGRLAVAFNGMLSELALARERELADQARSAEQALELLESVSRVASAAVDVRTLEVDCLEQIGKTGSWDFGQLWHLDPGAEVAKCSAESYFGGPEFEEYHLVSLKQTVRKGDAIPGLVWESRTPLWIADLDGKDDFSRIAFARAKGFKTVLAFPVIVDEEVILIFEFYSVDVRVLNHSVLDAVVKVGRLLGDILSRKRSELALMTAHSELARISQFSAMGVMTASIAHEIGQPIAAMVTNANAGLRWLSKTPPDLDHVKQVLNSVVIAGRHAGDVLQTIRAMFRKDTQEAAPLDINAIIRDVLALVDSEVKKQRVLVRIDLAESLPQASGNRTQLQQVILNLVMNAIEAMTSINDRQRVLRVQSEFREPDVLVTVEDSGTGIDPKNIERIFDPLFTTKPKGMGMGLSICRSIIEAHQGRLWASPNVGHGSTFHLVLPSASSGQNEGL